MGLNSGDLSWFEQAKRDRDNLKQIWVKEGSPGDFYFWLLERVEIALQKQLSLSQTPRVRRELPF